MKGRRHVVIGSAVALAITPLVVLTAAAAYLRHSPWQIPEDWRPSPETAADAGLSIRYLGVSTYEVSDGETTVLLDAAVTRPTIWQLVTAPVKSDPEVVERWVPEADFILVNHAHYDHLLDAPRIAAMTGATIVGSPSACNFALSRGVLPGQVREVRGGTSLQLGTFAVRVMETAHSPLLGRDDLMRGVMSKDAGALWFWQMEQDAALVFRLESARGSLLFHSSSIFTPQPRLDAVDVLIYGVSGAGLDAETAANVIGAARPAVFLPTHYDNFFQPLGKGMALLPFDDINGARAAVRRAAPELPWVVLDHGERIRVRARHAQAETE